MYFLLKVIFIQSLLRFHSGIKQSECEILNKWQISQTKIMKKEFNHRSRQKLQNLITPFTPSYTQLNSDNKLVKYSGGEYVLRVGCATPKINVFLTFRTGWRWCSMNKTVYQDDILNGRSRILAEEENGSRETRHKRTNYCGLSYYTLRIASRPLEGKKEIIIAFFFTSHPGYLNYGRIGICWKYRLRRIPFNIKYVFISWIWSHIFVLSSETRETFSQILITIRVDAHLIHLNGF